MSTTPTEVLETNPLEALDIDSIKAIMDGFDPASLLPELSEIFTTLPGICRLCVMIGPLVLLALGLAYLFFAPKEANWYFGYRCYYGMGSVEAWQFTQSLAGIVWGALGLILGIVMLLVSGGFAQLETMDLLWRAVYCLAWEAGAVAVGCIGVNTVVALRYDRKGYLRRKTRRT